METILHPTKRGAKLFSDRGKITGFEESAYLPLIMHGGSVHPSRCLRSYNGKQFPGGEIETTVSPSHWVR